MNQGSAHSAGQAPSAATVEFFQIFKKEIAAYLAQKISFSLFHKDKYPLLRKKITELVDEKLAFSKTKLEPEVRDRLINEIFDGLPKGPPLESGQTPVTEDSFSKLHKEVLSHLAQRLPDGLLNSAPKAQIAALVSRIAKEKLAHYPALDKATERKLLEKILERLDPSLVAFLPSEESVPLSAMEIEAEPSLEAELQRDVIFFLATNMDPSLFQAADRAALRKEMDRVLATRPDHLERPVSARMRDSILADIMAKGTIEFQL